MVVVLGRFYSASTGTIAAQPCSLLSILLLWKPATQSLKTNPHAPTVNSSPTDQGCWAIACTRTRLAFPVLSGLSLYACTHGELAIWPIHQTTTFEWNDEVEFTAARSAGEAHGIRTWRARSLSILRRSHLMYR